jgi:hypothetical protein
MLTTKRVVIATICGFIFGFICMTLASSNPSAQLSTAVKLTILFSRVLMCFTIGISAIRISWWMHGILIGFIGSIPMAFPIMDRPGIMIGTIVMGIIYGFLTELITSILFKSRSAGYISSK